MDDLEKLSNHLHTWLDRHRQAARVAPSVQEAAEEVDWQINLLATRPDDAHNVSTTQCDEQARMAFGRVGQLLPQMPEYTQGIDLRVNSITTSSSASANNYILQVADLGTPPTLDWARQAQESYRALQEAHHRHERVREMLVARISTVVDRFDAAVSAYQSARLGVGPQSGAAVEMRTVVDALKGELFERARKSADEKLTWATMSDRLASKAAGSALLLGEEENRRALYEDLSTVAKQRGARSLESLWSRTLDHLFVVLAETA